MIPGCPHGPARPRPQAEHRLHAVVDERARAHHTEPPVVAEGVQPDILASLAPSDELADSHAHPGGRLCDQRIGCQALPHGGSCSDDDQVAGLETRGEAVEVGEAGGHAGDLAAVVVQALDRLQGAGQHLAQALVVLAHAALGDLVDERLGDVDRPLGVLGRLETELHDPRAHVDQPAEDTCLLHDPGVVGGVRGRRHTRDEGEQEGCATDVL